MSFFQQLAVAERAGAFVVFSDDDGVRHAVRATSVIAASDADSSRETTVLQLQGGRFVAVRAPLEEVLGWLPGGALPGK